jgi:hypothetical protein
MDKENCFLKVKKSYGTRIRWLRAPSDSFVQRTDRIRYLFSSITHIIVHSKLKFNYLFHMENKFAYDIPHQNTFIKDSCRQQITKVNVY